MMGNYAFDSGLLVADPNEAYVVNGACRHWAARQVSSVEAISNRYQVRDDWDFSSLELDNGAKPDFRALFAEKALETSCGASERENAAQHILDERRGAIDVEDMADILRHVGDEDEYEVCYEGTPDKVCMHAAPGEMREWQATGAMIADLAAQGPTVWMTGTSATDLSIFKPLFFGMELPDMGPAPSGTYTEGALWWTHERLHRRAMADYATLKPEISRGLRCARSRVLRRGASGAGPGPGAEAGVRRRLLGTGRGSDGRVDRAAGEAQLLHSEPGLSGDVGPVQQGGRLPDPCVREDASTTSRERPRWGLQSIRP